MVMLFIEFAIIMFFAEAGLVLVGLGAPLLAYIGVLTVGGPRKGRGLTTAFLHAIPLAVVIPIVAGTSLAVAKLSDLGFSAPCHLTGDYALMMADADSPGWVYVQAPGNGGVSWQQDGIDGVLRLQVTGRYIVGGRDTRGFQRNAIVTEYFLIDTHTATNTRFATMTELEADLKPLGIPLELEPVYEIYRRDRRPPGTMIALIVVPGVLCSYLFLRWVRKLKTLRWREVAT
jgi:hypothetical protein